MRSILERAVSRRDQVKGEIAALDAFIAQAEKMLRDDADIPHGQGQTHPPQATFRPYLVS